MALEACISLTLFLIAMMALYSLINMFTAQSMISHALQQTGQSIALENYKNSKTDVKTLQKLPLSLLQKFTDGIGASSDSKYDVGGGSFSNSMVFTDYLSLINDFRKANPKCKIWICRLTPVSHRHPRYSIVWPATNTGSL